MPAGGAGLLTEVMHHRRLADTRWSSEEQEPGVPHADLLEGRLEASQRELPPVDFSRQLQAVAQVALAQLEGPEGARRFELAQATLEIPDEARGGLVAILGDLGEELVDDAREHRWRPRSDGVGARRGLGDVGVNQLQRIGRLKGSLTGRQLEEADSERVEVAALIDRATHAAGLLGRDAEVDERDGSAGLEEHVGWLEILVDDPLLVNGVHRSADGQGHPHELGAVEARSLSGGVHRLSVGILQNQRDAASDRLEADGPGYLGDPQSLEDRELPPQPLDGLSAWALVTGLLDDDPEAVSGSLGARNHRGRRGVDLLLEAIVGQLDHFSTLARLLRAPLGDATRRNGLHVPRHLRAGSAFADLRGQHGSPGPRGRGTAHPPRPTERAFSLRLTGEAPRPRGGA